jgi:hypothetical protein
VALVPVAIAALLTVVEGVRLHHAAELLLLAAVAAIVALTAVRLIPAFRATPASFRA